MCFTLAQSRMLEEEYPEIKKLIALLGRTSGYSREAVAARTVLGPVYSGRKAVRQEYCMLAGELFDYGPSDFPNPAIRREVAAETIKLMQEDLARK